MKILKPVIGTAFFAGIIGMFLAIAALESGNLDGATYWVLISACAVLSGGAILGAMVAYKYEERRTSHAVQQSNDRQGRR